MPPLLIEVVVPFVSDETGAAPGVLVVAPVRGVTSVLLVLEIGVVVETPVAELPVEAVDNVDVVDVVETPIVAAIATRLFIAQHASDVRSPPQHQLPSVKH